MGFIDWLVGRKALEKVDAPSAIPSSQTWSYCESDFATADGLWCIRRLTSRGRTARNNRMDRIETPSLCGRVPKGYGWDLYSVVQEDPVLERRVCPKCRELWRRQIQG